MRVMRCFQRASPPRNASVAHHAVMSNGVNRMAVRRRRDGPVLPVVLGLCLGPIEQAHACNRLPPSSTTWSQLTPRVCWNLTPGQPPGEVFFAPVIGSTSQSDSDSQFCCVWVSANLQRTLPNANTIHGNIRSMKKVSVVFHPIYKVQKNTFCVSDNVQSTKKAPPHFGPNSKHPQSIKNVYKQYKNTKRIKQVSTRYKTYQTNIKKVPHRIRWYF